MAARALTVVLAHDPSGKRQLPDIEVPPRLIDTLSGKSAGRRETTGGLEETEHDMEGRSAVLKWDIDVLAWTLPPFLRDLIPNSDQQDLLWTLLAVRAGTVKVEEIANVDTWTEPA